MPSKQCIITRPSLLNIQIVNHESAHVLQNLVQISHIIVLKVQEVESKDSYRISRRVRIPYKYKVVAIN